MRVTEYREMADKFIWYLKNGKTVHNYTDREMYDNWEFYRINWPWNRCHGQ
jgi:hypothetical protein